MIWSCSCGSSREGEASQRAAQNGQDKTSVRLVHEDKVSPPDDNRIDVEKPEKIQKNIMIAGLLLGPITTEVEKGVSAFSALEAMTEGAPAARGLSAQSSNILEASMRQLNKLFSKHGADFGLDGA